MARAVAFNRTAKDQKNQDLNSRTSQSQEFKSACESAGLKSTTRQASKFRRGLGLAFKKRQEG